MNSYFKIVFIGYVYMHSFSSIWMNPTRFQILKILFMNANFAIPFTFSMTWHEWISDFIHSVMQNQNSQVEGAGLWRSGAGISCCSACTIYSRENEKSKDRKPETDGPSPHAVLTNNKRCSSTSSPLHFLPPCRGKRASRTLSPSAGDYTEVWSSS